MLKSLERVGGDLKFLDMKMEDRYEENDFKEFLQDIVNLEVLESKEIGIAKLVIDKGYNFLTKKQKYVFDKNVVGFYYIEECKRCSINIPWSEMLNAYDNNNMCGYCEHVFEKTMKE